MWPQIRLSPHLSILLQSHHLSPPFFPSLFPPEDHLSLLLTVWAARTGGALCQSKFNKWPLVSTLLFKASTWQILYLKMPSCPSLWNDIMVRDCSQIAKVKITVLLVNCSCVTLGAAKGNTWVKINTARLYFMVLISKRSRCSLILGLNEPVCDHLSRDPPPPQARGTGSRLTRNDSFGEAHRCL